MSICRYGCGAEFPNTMEGKTRLMRHYKYECPSDKSPNARRLAKKEAKTMKKEPVTSSLSMGPSSEVRKETQSDIRDELYSEIKEQIKFYRAQQELQMLQKMVGGQDTDKEDSGKISVVIDNVPLKLTAQEWLSWKRYLADQKKDEAEREEKRARISPDLDKRIQALTDQFSQFQKDVLLSQIEVLKSELSAFKSKDPMSEFINFRKKLDGLGLSDQKTAQDKMFALDFKKVETAMDILKNKADTFTNRMDKLINLAEPLIKSHIQGIAQQAKQQQGGSIGSEVPLDEQLSNEQLQKLNELEKSLAQQEQEVPTANPNVTPTANSKVTPPEEPEKEVLEPEEPERRVISIEPTRKNPSTSKSKRKKK